MLDDLQYYPTPKGLALKAWAKFQDRDFERVLEPSAGEGHLVNAAIKNSTWANRHRSVAVDCIEMDLSKHSVLRDDGFDVVGIDFLAYQDASAYSHIIMNPPFAVGAQHVLHAWKVLYDGEIVAILNAETIRNPYTKEREMLARLISEHGSVEFLQEEFLSPDTERKTDVEVALVWLRKESGFNQKIVDDILRGLKQDAERDFAEGYEEAREVMLPNSVIENAVRVFDMAIDAARESVFAEARATRFEAMLGSTLENANGGFKPPAANDMAQVRKDIHKRYRTLKNRAWAGILRSSQVTSKLSSEAQRRLESEFETIKKLEFTVTNVYGFLLGIIEKRGDIQSGMLLDVFDLITKYHSDNAVYYMGWKSNDKHMTCGRRIKTTRFIIPGHTTHSWNQSLDWNSMQMLRDFDKVFAMVDGKVAPEVSLEEIFTKQFSALKNGERISSSYFDVRYYPGAGTIHFFARDKKLIDRFNRMVGRLRNWIPPADEAVSEAFWLQFDQAEKFDSEIRKEVNAAERRSWRDPFWALTSNDNERAAESAHIVGSAIAATLEKRGIKVADVLSQSLGQSAPLMLCA